MAGPRTAPDGSDPIAAAFSATQDVQDAVAAKPGSRIDIFAKGSARDGAKAQPAQIASDSVAASSDSSPTDPILAQLLAAQQAMPVTNAPSSTQASATQAVEQTDAATGNQAPDPTAPAAPTDATAASVLTGGATVKPGKADALQDAAPAGDQKSQKQATFTLYRVTR